MKTFGQAAARAGVGPATVACTLAAAVLLLPSAALARVQRADIPTRTIVSTQLETDTFGAAEWARVSAVEIPVAGGVSTCAAGETLVTSGGTWACGSANSLSGTITQNAALTVEPATFTTDWQVVDGSATSFRIRGDEAGNPAFLTIDTSAALEAITLGSAGVGAVTITTDAAGGGDAELVVPTRSINAENELGIGTCAANNYLRVDAGGTTWSCSAGVAPGPDSVTTTEIAADAVTAADFTDAFVQDDGAAFSMTFDTAGETFTVNLLDNTASSFVMQNGTDVANDYLIVTTSNGAEAVTVGNSAAGTTVAITSADWTIGTTGNMAGIGSLTMDGALTVNAAASLGNGADAITVGSAGATDNVVVTDADWSVDANGLITANDGQGFTCQGGGTCTYDAGGANAIVIGSADVTTVTVNSDSGITFTDGGDSINNTADDIFDFTRDDAGTVTITASDNDATAALTVASGGAARLTLDSGGASDIMIGSADVTNVTIDSDVGLTFAENAESIVNSADATFDFTRNDVGVVTLTCSDTDATAGCVYDAGGASPIQVGSADVTGIDLLASQAGSGPAMNVRVTNGASGTVTLSFQDWADTTDDDMAHAILTTDCSDVGAGTEDCDFTIGVTEAGGAVETRFLIDADAGVTIGSANNAAVTLSTGAITGDAAVVLPVGSVSAGEILNNTIDFADISDTPALDGATTITGTDAATLTYNGNNAALAAGNTTMFDVQLDSTPAITAVCDSSGGAGFTCAQTAVRIGSTSFTVTDSDVPLDGGIDNFSLILDDNNAAPFAINDTSNDAYITIVTTTGAETMGFGDVDTDPVVTFFSNTGTDRFIVNGNANFTAGVDVTGSNLTVGSALNLVLDTGAAVTMTLNPDAAGGIVFTRSTGGTVTFSGADDAGAADTVYDTTLTGAITVGSGDVTAVTISTDNTGDGTDFQVPTSSITSGEILDVTRDVQLPLQAWWDYTNQLPMDATGADAEPDLVVTGGLGMEIAYDDTGGSPDTNQIGTSFAVPQDWASGGAFRVCVIADGATGANTENIDCEVSVNGAAFTATGATNLASQIARQCVTVTPGGAYAAGASVAATCTQGNAAADDTIFIQSISWTYTATQ